MATLSHPASTTSQSASWLSTYKQFVDKAEFTRFGWSVSALAIQGCILSPVLLLTMAYFGGGDWQFLTSMLGFLLVLVPILGAMPVKNIFPAFAISAIVHIAIILFNIL